MGAWVSSASGSGRISRPPALEVTEQPLPVPERHVLLAFEQRPGGDQGLLVALFEESLAQLPVQLAVFLAEFLDGLFRHRLVARFPPVKMVEASGDLARDLDVGHLVLAHRHQAGTVYKDVGALEQRVTEKAIGREVAVRHLRLLVLVRRHALEPGQRRNHGQQHVQLGVGRHA